MIADIRRITRHVRNYYDRDLCAKQDGDKICIFRKNKRWVYYSFNGVEFGYPHESLDYVCALTDTWALNGNPVMWGIDHIFQHLKEIDGRENPKLMESIEKQNEKVDELVKRRRKNNNEAFLRDWRRSFAKATNHINTSSLEKIDKRRIKDGYRKP